MKELQALVIQNFFKIATSFIIVVGFFYFLSPFLIPVILGGILSMAFSTFLESLINRGMSRKKAMTVMSLALIILVLGPVGLFAARTSKAVTQLMVSKDVIIQMGHKVEAKVAGLINQASLVYEIDTIVIQERMKNMITRVGEFLISTISNFISELPDLFLLGFITFISFYFFLVKEKSIRKLFNRYFFFSKENGNRFVLVLKTSCREIFVSNVITGVIQSLIVAIGALICQIGDFYLIFMFTFICSFIPVIGAAPMAFLLAAMAALDQRYGAAIGMCVVGVISGLSDNILRPYLVSRGEVEVPGVIGLLCIIGGVILIGLPGLFVGPLFASLFFGALPIIVDEYFSTDVEE